MLIYLFIQSFIAFCIFHTIVFFTIQCVNPQWKEKQKAWILTLITAMIMFCCSFGFLIIFFMKKAIKAMALVHVEYETAMGGFFVSFLVMDLILGLRFYPTQIQLLTGYIHHFVYIFLSLFCLREGLGCVMVLVGVLELPTIVLALGHLNSNCRNDLLFGFTFFMCRIVYHLWLVYELFCEFQFPYYLFLLFNFPIHILWFRGWILQQKRKRNLKPKWEAMDHV